MAYPLQWDKTQITWDELALAWDLSVITGAGNFDEEIYKYDAEKKRKLVKLILKVYGNTNSGTGDPSSHSSNKNWQTHLAQAFLPAIFFAQAYQRISGSSEYRPQGLDSW